MAGRLNNNVLESARDSYTRQLKIHLTRLVYDGLVSIYDESRKIEEDTFEYDGNYMKQFQKQLCCVPKWNQSILEDETRRILDEIDFLMDIVTAVFVSHVQILASVRIGNNTNQIRVRVPAPELFIHSVYCKAAESFYYSPRCFGSHNVRENNEFIKEMINQSIEDTIDNMIPIENIVKEYITDTFNSHAKATNKPAPVVQNKKQGRLLTQYDLGFAREDQENIPENYENNENIPENTSYPRTPAPYTTQYTPAPNPPPTPYTPVSSDFTNYYNVSENLLPTTNAPTYPITDPISGSPAKSMEENILDSFGNTDGFGIDKMEHLDSENIEPPPAVFDFKDDETDIFSTTGKSTSGGSSNFTEPDDMLSSIINKSKVNSDIKPVAEPEITEPEISKPTITDPFALSTDDFPTDIPSFTPAPTPAQASTSDTDMFSTNTSTENDLFSSNIGSVEMEGLGSKSDGFTTPEVSTDKDSSKDTSLESFGKMDDPNFPSFY